MMCIESSIVIHPSSQERLLRKWQFWTMLLHPNLWRDLDSSYIMGGSGVFGVSNHHVFRDQGLWRERLGVTLFFATSWSSRCISWVLGGCSKATIHLQINHIKYKNSVSFITHMEKLEKTLKVSRIFCSLKPYSLNKSIYTSKPETSEPIGISSQDCPRVNYRVEPDHVGKNIFSMSLLSLLNNYPAPKHGSVL